VPGNNANRGREIHGGGVLCIICASFQSPFGERSEGHYLERPGKDKCQGGGEVRTTGLADDVDVQPRSRSSLGGKVSQRRNWLSRQGQRGASTSTKREALVRRGKGLLPSASGDKGIRKVGSGEWRRKRGKLIWVVVYLKGVSTDSPYKSLWAQPLRVGHDRGGRFLKSERRII